MQLDIFNIANEDRGAQQFNLQNGTLIYYPHFYKAIDADLYFDLIRAEAIWKQETIKIYGQDVLYPRLTSWYGDNDSNYKFSGTKFAPNQWTETLLKIRDDINKAEPSSFNSVLLNLYRNGNDSVSWHTDAEPELGINPVIASVNFGAARKFMLRRINDHTQKMELILQHGSLLVMKGELQHHWQHQVPKSVRITHERINLTYRYINH